MAILYVEDDALTRQTIAGRLRRRGFAVVEAPSDEEALDAAERSSNPTAGLLDVDLPGINGLETYRRLRALRPGLPAVVCSAWLPLGTRQPFRDLGVPEHCLLAKPCPFSELLAALQNVTSDFRVA